jgi:hypothetical protein
VDFYAFTMPITDAYAILSGLSDLSRVFRILPVSNGRSFKKGVDPNDSGNIGLVEMIVNRALCGLLQFFQSFCLRIYRMTEAFCFKPAFRRFLNKKYDLTEISSS